MNSSNERRPDASSSASASCVATNASMACCGILALTMAMLRSRPPNSLPSIEPSWSWSSCEKIWKAASSRSMPRSSISSRSSAPSSRRAEARAELLEGSGEGRKALWRAANGARGASSATMRRAASIRNSCSTSATAELTANSAMRGLQALGSSHSRTHRFAKSEGSGRRASLESSFKSDESASCPPSLAPAFELSFEARSFEAKLAAAASAATVTECSSLPATSRVAQSLASKPSGSRPPSNSKTRTNDTSAATGAILRAKTRECASEAAVCELHSLRSCVAKWCAHSSARTSLSGNARRSALSVCGGRPSHSAGSSSRWSLPVRSCHTATSASIAPPSDARSSTKCANSSLRTERLLRRLSVYETLPSRRNALSTAGSALSSPPLLLATGLKASLALLFKRGGRARAASASLLAARKAVPKGASRSACFSPAARSSPCAAHCGFSNAAARTACTATSACTSERQGPPSVTSSLAAEAASSAVGARSDSSAAHCARIDGTATCQSVTTSPPTPAAAAAAASAHSACAVPKTNG
mmetsp:Transcript_34648/g.86438  ORF Transcript_34648/g.86438 Transcript_34648/m.86438 type:complete len:534 (+) Transcript_34648:280-1881(+)